MDHHKRNLHGAQPINFSKGSSSWYITDRLDRSASKASFKGKNWQSFLCREIKIPIPHKNLSCAWHFNPIFISINKEAKFSIINISKCVSCSSAFLNNLPIGQQSNIIWHLQRQMFCPLRIKLSFVTRCDFRKFLLILMWFS